MPLGWLKHSYLYLHRNQVTKGINVKVKIGFSAVLGGWLVVFVLDQSEPGTQSPHLRNLGTAAISTENKDYKLTWAVWHEERGRKLAMSVMRHITLRRRGVLAMVNKAGSPL